MKKNDTSIKTDVFSYNELLNLVNFYIDAKKLTKTELIRLNYELNVIESLGIADIILFGYKLKNSSYYAVSLGAECCAFINYLIGITPVNPVKYNLPFSRFTNEYRSFYPGYCFYVKKGYKGAMLDTAYHILGENNVVKSRDDDTTYFYSSVPFSSDIISKTVMVNEGCLAYQENITDISCGELYVKGYKSFTVIEVSNVKFNNLGVLTNKVINDSAFKLFSTTIKNAVTSVDFNAKEFETISDLKAILKSTNGKLLYQEQLIKLLEKVCDFTEEEADFYRREIAKCKRQSLLKIENILTEKYGDAGEKLCKCLSSIGRYTFLKAYVIATTLVTIEN